MVSKKNTKARFNLLVQNENVLILYWFLQSVIFTAATPVSCSAWFSCYQYSCFSRFLLALKDKPENNLIEDELVQKKNVTEINLKLQDKKDPGTCLVPLAEKSSETKSRPSIPEQQPPSWRKVATKAVLSPLTLFLLGTECTKMYDPVYEKWLGRKRRKFLNRARGNPMYRTNYACLK